MANNELNVKITADSDGIVTGSQQGSEAFKNASNQISDSANDLMGIISKVGPAIAACFIVKEAINAIESFNKYNETILQFSRVLGETTERASVLATAINIIGGTTESYISMNMKLDRQVRTNESSLNSLGMTTRGTNNQLLSQEQLFENAISTMRDYESGVEQNKIAIILFGRGSAEVYKYLELNNEVMKRAEEVTKNLGLTLTTEGSEKAIKFSQDFNVMKLTLSSIAITTGSELMPALSDLSETMQSLASGGLPALSFGLKGLITVFDVTLWWSEEFIDACIGIVRGLYYVISGASSAISKFIDGDIKGAISSIKETSDNLKVQWRATTDTMVEDTVNTYKKIDKIWNESLQKTKKLKSGEKQAPDDDSQLMNQLKHQLEIQKETQDISLDQEKLYWSKILETTNAGSKNKAAIQTEIDILSKKIRDKSIIDEMKNSEELTSISEKETAAKKIELEKQYSAGVIGASKLQALTLELDEKLKKIYEDQVNEYIILENKKPAIAEEVSRKIIAINSKMEATLDKDSKIAAQKYDISWKQALNNLDNQFASSLTGMINKQKSFGNVMQSLAQDLEKKLITIMMEQLQKTEAFLALKNAIQKGWAAIEVALGIATEQDKTIAIVEGGAEQQAAVDLTGSVEEENAVATGEVVASANETQAISNVGMGATAVFAGWADIPYVGEVLGAAAAAAYVAANAPFMSMAAASGGYDVPQGINPVTKLHENEMVLPANLANKVRNMTGGDGGGGNKTSINIQALDTKSFFNKNGRTILKSLVKSAKSMGMYR
jgi:hypothetical protein